MRCASYLSIVSSEATCQHIASLNAVNLCRLRASPGMRPSDGWKRVKARQYYCTAQPGYIWAATITLAPLMWIRGWDCYLRGELLSTTQGSCTLVCTQQGLLDVALVAAALRCLLTAAWSAGLLC